MNPKLEGLMEEYNSIVRSINGIKNEYRHEESQFKTALSNIQEYINSLKQFLPQIDVIREEINQNESGIFSGLKQKYPNIKDEDINSSMEYAEEKRDIENDRNSCGKLENSIKETIHECEREIETIKMKEIKFKEEQEEKRNYIRHKILSYKGENVDSIGIIQSHLKRDDIELLEEEVYEAGTEAEYELSIEFSTPFTVREDFWTQYPNGTTYEGGSSFRKGEECTSLKDKDMIEQRKRRMEQLRQSAEENPQMYEQEGRIMVQYLDIPMTQRELIDAGLDPERFGWKSLEQIKEESKKEVTPKTISKLTSGLPKRAIEAIKGLFSRKKDERKDERGE